MLRTISKQERKGTQIFYKINIKICFLSNKTVVYLFQKQ